MKIEELNITEIKPYEKNPRNNDDSVDGVAESIRQFGFQQPIVIDKKNVIICGHTRYLASKKLGLEKAPCVRAEELTAKQVKAYRLLDNKLAEKSTWNLPLLDNELSNLDFEFKPFDVDFNIDRFNKEEERDDKTDSDVHEPPIFKNKFKDTRKETEAGGMPTSFKLVVSCDSEEQQRALYDRLKAEGYEVGVCNF